MTAKLFTRRVQAVVVTLTLLAAIFTPLMAPGPVADVARTDAASAPELAGQHPDAPPLQEDGEGEEAEHEDLPWVPIVVLAVLVPLAALLVPSFLLGGKGAERGSAE